MTSRRAVLGALALLPPLALSSAACSETQNSVAYVVPSRDLQTSEINGTFTITGEGGKLTAHASFANARSSDIVALDGADAVYCDGVRLEQSGTWIGVAVPRKAAGQPYRFELRRAHESVFVYVLAIDEVKVLAPPAGAELSQTGPVTVTWAPNAGTEVDAQLFANCAMSKARATTESGSITLPAFTPVGVPGGPQNASNPPCDGTVSLVRTRKSDAATALARSVVVAEETDRVKVRVVK